MPGSLVCPVCGALNSEGATFCANCGWSPPMASGGAAPGPTPANRRKPPLLMIGAFAAAGVVLVLAVVLVATQVLGGNQQTVQPPPGGAETSPADPPAGTPSPNPSPSDTPTPTPTQEPAPDYEKIKGQVQSGVLKVFASGCGQAGSRVGSAFLISKTTAVASYASLAGAQVVAVTSGSTTVPATVKSAAPKRGVVILKLARPVDGHVFSIDDTEIADGDPVGLIGMAADNSNTELTTSSVVAVDDQARVGGATVGGLARIDAEADPGLSGAPVLGADGSATGMAFTGPGFNATMVVPGSAVAAARQGNGSLPGSNCKYPTGPDVTMISGDKKTGPHQVLRRYFEAINTGDYDTAYDQVVHDGGRVLTSEEKAKGWRSTYDFDITVHRITGRGANARAHVSFTSIFVAGAGPQQNLTCAHWNLDYTFAQRDGDLLIDKVNAHSGGKLWRKC